MSSFTSSANNSTSTKPLAAAFSAVAKANAESSLTDGITWNGDINFSSLGDDFQSALLALDQKMVLPEACRKTRELDEATKAILDSYFDAFTSIISSWSDVERAKAYGLMFRYMFYLRSVRVAVKKSRLLFYYLFKRLYTRFPNTCVALVELVPEFGYFGDLDTLIQQMGDYPDVVDAAERVYIKYLDADCLLMFSKPLAKVTKNEAQALNNQLKTMSSEQVRAFVGARRLSLAAKWFKREGKHNSAHRDDVLIQVYFPNGGIRDLQKSTSAAAQQLAKKRLSYCQMVFRNVITTLSQCVLVGEQMMCEQDESHRTWADINHETAPAKFLTKYRKALANEDLKVPLSEQENETGIVFSAERTYWLLSSRASLRVPHKTLTVYQRLFTTTSSPSLIAMANVFVFLSHSVLPSVLLFLLNGLTLLPSSRKKSLKPLNKQRLRLLLQELAFLTPAM